MSEITIPDNVAAALTQARGRVHLRSQSGQLLGEFTPEPLVPWDPSITREDIERIAREPGGSSLDDILKRLGAS